MGIKFLCDRCGKKLNVKAFLAGKRGICPKCGAKVKIPDDLDNSVNKAGHSRVGAAATSTGPTQIQQPTQPLAAPAAQAGPAPAAQVAYAAAPVATTMATPAAIPATVPAGVQSGGLAASPATVDPIAAAPTAMWYIRPSSGGQYGPANGDLLKHWIDQGRVGADSLVWREGWADWQQANLLFPQMGTPTAEPTLPNPGSMTQPTSSVTVSTEPRAGGYRRPLRRTNTISITIVMLLSVLAVGLLAGLVFIVSQG